MKCLYHGWGPWLSFIENQTSQSTRLSTSMKFPFFYLFHACLIVNKPHIIFSSAPKATLNGCIGVERRGVKVPCPPIPGENMMVGNGGQMIGSLIHSHKAWGVSGCLCKIFFHSPTLSQTFHHSNRIKLGILHFCVWLQHKS